MLTECKLVLLGKKTVSSLSIVNRRRRECHVSIGTAPHPERWLLDVRCLVIFLRTNHHT